MLLFFSLKLVYLMDTCIYYVLLRDLLLLATLLLFFCSLLLFLACLLLFLHSFLASFWLHLRLR